MKNISRNFIVSRACFLICLVGLIPNQACAKQNSPAPKAPRAAPTSTSERPPFRFGVYASGADSDGFRYYADPLALNGADAYIRRAFREAKDIGFDFFAFNHTPPEMLPLLLREAERAGLLYIYEGTFPAYYEHHDGFDEFLPEDAPGSQNLEERRERRRRMREETLPFLREWLPQFRSNRTLLAWTPTEEIPRDPMIYSDLAEIAAVHREADPTHPVSYILHFLEAIEEMAPVARPGMIRIEPFGITAELRAQEGRSDWLLWEAETRMTADDWIERGYRAARGVGADLTVYGGAWWNEIRGEEGRWRNESHLMPTEGEIRAELWLSIIAGAKAFEVFSYNSIDDAGQAAAARRAGREPYGEGAADYNHRTIGLYRIDGTPTPMVAMTRKIIAEVKPLAQLIGQLDRDEASSFTAIYRRAADASGQRSPIRLRGFRHIGTGAPGTGAEYVIVMNADPVNAHPLDHPIATRVHPQPRVRVLPDGEWTDPMTLELTLPPGGGAVIEREQWEGK